MNEDLERKIFSELKQRREVKNNTAKVYISTLNTLSKKLGISEGYKSLHWLRKSGEVIKAIEDSGYKESTKHRFYTTLMTVLPLMSKEEDVSKIPGYNRYLAMFNQKLQIRDEKTKSQKMSEKEEKGWLSKEEIEKVADILLQTRDLGDYIAWLVMTKIPPRRGLDYSKMIVTTNNIENNARNYIVRNKDKFQGFVFNNFKNANGDPQVFNRAFFTDNFGKDGKEFVTILDKYLKLKKDGDPFLKKIFTQSNFSKYIVSLSKPITGKHTNGNIFRHMYVSNFMKKAPFQKEREIVASFMSHTLREQSNYRKREEDEDEKKDEKKYDEIEGLDIKKDEN